MKVIIAVLVYDFKTGISLRGDASPELIEAYRDIGPDGMIEAHRKLKDTVFVWYPGADPDWSDRPVQEVFLLGFTVGFGWHRDFEDAVLRLPADTLRV